MIVEIRIYKGILPVIARIRVGKTPIEEIICLKKAKGLSILNFF